MQWTSRSGNRCREIGPSTAEVIEKKAPGMPSLPAGPEGKTLRQCTREELIADAEQCERDGRISAAKYRRRLVAKLFGD